MQQTSLKIMVSSSIYNQEELLDQLYGVLTGYGYHVFMSHKGTIPVLPRKSNFENCLAAVDACDIFFGIINGRYGSGRTGDELSITHREIQRAIEINKPRYFVVHYPVAIARQVLRQFRIDPETNEKRHHSFFNKTAILDDIRILDMYEDAAEEARELAVRTDNWIQEYKNKDDLFRYIEHQLSDTEKIRAAITAGQME